MEKEYSFVSGGEQVQVSRALLDWFNEYGGFPDRVKQIEAEFLGNGTSMGLFAVTSAYKTKEFINGAYDAQYQFALQYRTAPQNSEKRLDAMDVLSGLADWAEAREDLPDLGPDKESVSIERNSTAVMTARYEDGSEDYQILMSFNYSVKSKYNF